MQTHAKGFTLIELMIVVVIIAIISAIALPAYTKYVRDTRRAAAQGCLAELAQFMERYYTTNMKYQNAVLPATSCSADLAGFYTFSFNGAPTATAFSVQAAPQGEQTKDSCGTLRIDEQGNKTKTGAGTDCW